MFVKEVSGHYHRDINKFKMAYDCISCAVAVAMSLLFFGRFEGVKIGTVLCAFLNGWLIGIFSRLMEKRFAYRDALKLRRYFE